MPSLEAAQTASLPALTPEQKHLVQESLAAIEANADHIVQSFYARLFELNPKAKALFKGDLKEQGRKLIGMIRTTIGSLDRLEAIAPNLKLLGNAHRLIGVSDRDYEPFKEALLSTLAQNLKSAFTPKVRDAWSAVFEVFASIMIGK